MHMPVAKGAVNFEKTTALVDAKWAIDEWGGTITYYKREESDIQRDKYDSLKRKDVITATIILNAFPISFNPTNNQLEKAGLREKVDVMVNTAMLDWIDANIVPADDIDVIRDSMVLDGKTYGIKEVGFTNHFSNTFLNVSLGLVLR